MSCGIGHLHDTVVRSNGEDQRMLADLQDFHKSAQIKPAGCSYFIHSRGKNSLRALPLRVFPLQEEKSFTHRHSSHSK